MQIRKVIFMIFCETNDARAMNPSACSWRERVRTRSLGYKRPFLAAMEENTACARYKYRTLKVPTAEMPAALEIPPL